MKTNISELTLMLMAVAALDTASAQLILTGTNYTETFDSIGSGLPPGWSVRTNASTSGSGSAASFATTNMSWGTTAGQFANYASSLSNQGTNFLGGESTTIQSNCLNRCVGVRQTASFGDPGAAFVLQLSNTLGFGNFQLSVDLNLLSVQSRTNTWIIDYGVGANPGSYAPVWTNTDSGVFGATTRTVSFGAALDNQAQNVWIRVVALDATTGSGSRDTFGIDNFLLNYSAYGTVSPIPLHIRLDGTNAVMTWSNAAFSLQAAPSVTGSYTNVPGATNPHTHPIAGPQKYFRLKAN
jgi:trimeric autotransporter adhesin